MERRYWRRGLRHRLCILISDASLLALSEFNAVGKRPEAESVRCLKGAEAAGVQQSAVETCSGRSGKRTPKGTDPHWS
jgi:hypothetical protein